MKTINLIKSKPGIVDWIFILSGGHFYLNWILPTNPASKNPIIKFLWGWMKNGYMGNNPPSRYKLAYIYGGIHVAGAIFNGVAGQFWHPLNILINIYPTIVQLYIGYRCWKVIRFKSSNAKYQIALT